MIIMPVKEGENIEKALKKFKRKYGRSERVAPPPVFHQAVDRQARGDAACDLRGAHEPRRRIAARHGRFEAVQAISIGNRLLFCVFTPLFRPPVVGRNAARFGLPSRAASFQPASRNRDAKHDGVFLRIGMNVAARRRMFPFSLARKPFFDGMGELFDNLVYLRRADCANDPIRLVHLLICSHEKNVCFGGGAVSGTRRLRV